MARQQITELQAVAQTKIWTFEAARQQWSATYSEFREAWGPHFLVSDEREAVFDFGLAAIALDMQALLNLFPREQAERITKWIFATSSSQERGAYVKSELVKYADAFQRELYRIMNGGRSAEWGRSPIDAVSERLLHHWLGKGVAIFEAEFSGKNLGFIAPALVEHLSTTLCQFPFVGAWKRLHDQYELVLEDLPCEFVERVARL